MTVFCLEFLFRLGVYHLVNLWALKLLSARNFISLGRQTDVVPWF